MRHAFFVRILVVLACAPAVRAQTAITNIEVRDDAVCLAWTESTNLALVAVATSLEANAFAYVGDVLATHTARVPQAGARLFCRVRRVGVVQVPDAGLEAAMRAAMPAAHAPPDFVYDVDAEGITNLDARSAGIADPAGLEALTSAVRMDLGGNALSSLTLPLPALQALDCGDNLLGNLDLGGCAGLRALSCDNNFLPVLDLASCAGLESLSCRINQLQGLDLSACRELRQLRCQFNLLTNLDLSACTNLLAVACDDNAGLSRLELGTSACTNLSCARGALTSLNLSGCPSLAALDCRGNALTDVRLGACANLRRLACDDNALPVLDLSLASNLEVLSCANNLLGDLDVSACGNLRELYADNNGITSVASLGTLSQLRTISLLGNPIQTLDPLIALASTYVLAGCKLYVSGPIEPAEIAALEGYQVDVTHFPSWP